MMNAMDDFNRVNQTAGIALLALIFLASGCAAPSAPPIGQWFGPTTPATVSIQNLPQLDATARVVKTAHYDIYTTIGDTELLNKIAQLMEGSLTAYQTLAPDTQVSKTPMECYIFRERNQWAEFTREHTGEQAPLYLQINRGGYTIGDWYVAYYIGEGSTLSVAAHEGWHQFVARHFKGRLPAFLEEGLATMFEGVQFKNGVPCYNLSINQNRAILLRSAIESNSLWPLEDLIGMNAGQIVARPGNKIDAWYAQAWALGRFLWDGDNAAHRPILRQILADTADGTIYDPTGPHHNRLRGWSALGAKAMFEHYFGESFDKIEADYQTFCRHVAYDELPAMSEQP
jgi:hypothetical protein